MYAMGETGLRAQEIPVWLGPIGHNDTPSKVDTLIEFTSGHVLGTRVWLSNFGAVHDRHRLRFVPSGHKCLAPPPHPPFFVQRGKSRFEEFSERCRAAHVRVPPPYTAEEKSPILETLAEGDGKFNVSHLHIQLHLHL